MIRPELCAPTTQSARWDADLAVSLEEEVEEAAVAVDEADGVGIGTADVVDVAPDGGGGGGAVDELEAVLAMLDCMWLCCAISWRVCPFSLRYMT